MDKELLRIVIIATGLVVIMGMLLWGYFRNQRVSQDLSYFDDDENLSKESPQKFNVKDYAETDDDFELDVVPLGSARYSDGQQKSAFPDVSSSDVQQHEAVGSPKMTMAQEYKATPATHLPQVDLRENLPRLVQFSIVAKDQQGFNGSDLAAVFSMVGLEYGNVKIYERLDINRMVDFAVANILNPGTFPESDEELAEFYTPGVTFFMQPRELPDPVLVFDDLVRTINLIAKELDGQKWDAERKPLVEFTLKQIRKSLQVN